MPRPLAHRQEPWVLFSITAGSVVALRSFFSLLFLPVPDKLPPLGFFLILSFLSLSVFKLFQRVRRRKILDLVLSLVSIAVSSVVLFHWSWRGSSGAGFLGLPSLTGVLDWYALCLIILSVGAHWMFGINCSRMDVSHSRILMRFDSGIGLMLFIAFLRWGMKMEDPYTFHAVGLYILLGLIALYHAKRRESEGTFHHPKSLLRSVGAFLALGSISLGIAILTFPLLTYSAETLYQTAYSLLSPLSPYLIRILRFLLGFTFARPVEPVASTVALGKDLSAGIEEPAWLQFLAKVLGWGSLGLVGILGLVILTLLSKLLIQALLQSRGEGLPLSLVLRRFLHETIASARILLYRIHALCRNLRTTCNPFRRVGSQDIHSSIDPSLRRFYSEVSRSLKTIHKVGRLVGMKRLSYETLRQHVGRVATRFPSMKQPIETIQLIVEKFWYGPSIELDTSKAGTNPLKELRSARRTLWGQMLVCFIACWRR